MSVRLFRTYALLFSVVILAVMLLLGLQIRSRNRAEAVAAVKGIDTDAAIRMTAENAKRLFSIA